MLDIYHLKRGVAMELRFAQRARATKDLGIGISGTRADRLRLLLAALQLGFGLFRLRAEVKDIEQTDTIRVLVSLQYRSRA